MIVHPGFLAPAYGARDARLGSDRAVNIMARTGAVGSKAERYWTHTPGASLFAVQTAAAGCRGAYTASNGRCFFVFGSAVVEIGETGTRTFRGTLTTSSGVVRMADDGISLLVVDGAAARVLTFASNAWAAIADLDFPQRATHVGFIDGRFVVNEPASNRGWYSGIYDVTDWDGGFFSSEGVPDEVTGLVVAGRLIWTVGTRSAEVFYDAGDVDQVFQRIDSGVVEIGCASPQTLVGVRGRAMWLGGGPDGARRVWASNGYQAEPVSAPGIEAILAAASTVADAFAWSYSMDGSTFYVLQLPTAERTLVYDLDLQEWHERGWTDPNDGSFRRWRPVHGVDAHGLILAGDGNGDAVYSLEAETYVDARPDGSGTWWNRRLRYVPPMTQRRTRARFPRAELEAVAGWAPITGQGSDPVVMLGVSDDGGVTFDGLRHATLGRIGQRTARAFWTMLGISDDRGWLISQSDPVPVLWTAFLVEMQGLR